MLNLSIKARCHRQKMICGQCHVVSLVPISQGQREASGQMTRKSEGVGEPKLCTENTQTLLNAILSDIRDNS